MLETIRRNLVKNLNRFILGKVFENLHRPIASRFAGEFSHKIAGYLEVKEKAKNSDGNSL